MNTTLFSATGCIRCRMAAAFMDERGMSYEKEDALGQGKDVFKQFYREHRSAVTRGPDGIAFPILFTGDTVVQGLGPVLAFLQAGAALDSFVTLDHSPMDGSAVWTCLPGPCRTAPIFWLCFGFSSRNA